MSQIIGIIMLSLILVGLYVMVSLSVGWKAGLVIMAFAFGVAGFMLTAALLVSGVWVL